MENSTLEKLKKKIIEVCLAKHRVASLKRWIDCLLLSVIGSLVAVLLFPQIDLLVRTTIESLVFWPPWIGYLLGVFFSSILSLLVIQFKGFHRLHLMKPRMQFRYPPALFSGLLGFCIYINVLPESYLTDISNVPNYISSNLFLNISVVPIGFLLVCFSQYVNDLMSPRATDDIEMDSDKAWLYKEKPIENPEEDRFGAKYIASRIATKLLDKKLNTVGLIGSYGSGKSSVLNLVEYYLNNPSELSENPDKFEGSVIVGKVDAWGRVEGAIAQQILFIAIERLSKEVDCLSVVNVPGEYISAMKGTKNQIMGIISTFLSNKENPLKVLEKIDNILDAIKIRLVVFVEDIDRNISSNTINDDVPALLDRLKDLNNMSFVLSIGTESKYSSILIRVCEHREVIV